MYVKCFIWNNEMGNFHCLSFLTRANGNIFVAISFIYQRGFNEL